MVRGRSGMEVVKRIMRLRGGIVGGEGEGEDGDAILVVRWVGRYLVFVEASCLSAVDVAEAECLGIKTERDLGTTGPPTI